MYETGNHLRFLSAPKSHHWPQDWFKEMESGAAVRLESSVYYANLKRAIKTRFTTVT